jgi:hypothetical protein
MHTVTDAELAEHPGDVGLHGRFGQVEPGGVVQLRDSRAPEPVPAVA